MKRALYLGKHYAVTLTWDMSQVLASFCSFLMKCLLNAPVASRTIVSTEQLPASLYSLFLKTYTFPRAAQRESITTKPSNKKVGSDVSSINK